MAFKNKNGTVNSFPIVLIFTVLAIAGYLLLFGLDIKKKVEEVVDDFTTNTTKQTETTTIKLCNGCSMSFISDSFDFSTNADVDVRELLNLDKVSLRSVQFSSSNEQLVNVKSYANSFKVVTSNLNGQATITAKYDNITISAVINVINPSNGTVRFKYDYYFVAKGKNISPELSTYPYGLNISDVTYQCADEKIVSKSFRGNQVGETICYVVKNGKKQATKVFVVYDYIRVKTNQSGEYQEARSITPNGNSFDIQITYDRLTKKDFDQTNIQLDTIRNDIGATIKYVGPAANARTWIYHVEAPGTGKTVLKISIPDEDLKNKPGFNSFTYFEINK